jgi:hypothetical protein
MTVSLTSVNVVLFQMSEKAAEGDDGSLPKMRNQPQWVFTCDEDEVRCFLSLHSMIHAFHFHHFTPGLLSLPLQQRGNIVIDIAVEKFLATHLIDVDIHPLWFQIKAKGKLMLLHVPEEVPRLLSPMPCYMFLVECSLNHVFAFCRSNLTRPRCNESRQTVTSCLSCPRQIRRRLSRRCPRKAPLLLPLPPLLPPPLPPPLLSPRLCQRFLRHQLMRAQPCQGPTILLLIGYAFFFFFFFVAL